MTTRYFFTPPTVAANAPTSPDASAIQNSLFRFYEPRLRGVNVFQLADGTFVQDTPTVENANSNVPYPIGNPSNIVSSGWDPYNNVQLTTTIPNPVVVVFYGGHVTEVSQQMAASLTAAGYGGNVTTVP